MEVRKGEKFLVLPALISNGMVLQRDTKLKIWGYANANEEITIEFLEYTYKGFSNRNSKWEIIIDKLKPCKPFNMYISTFETICIENILVGDVWLCSGQSNMELPISRVKNMFAKKIKHINNKYIRQFRVECVYDFNEKKTEIDEGTWKSAEQNNIMNFTAAGYFFAEKLYNDYKIPIGLILNAVGGSPIEAWVSEENIKKYENYYNELLLCKEKKYVSSISKFDEERFKEWHNQLDNNDKGLNCELKWIDKDYDDRLWKKIDLLADWEENDELNKNGSFWFRKEINISEKFSLKKGKIFLGTIVDEDYCYINGKFVGSTGYRYPPREYEIPEGLLRKGKNNITVRIISNRDIGGFIKDKPYYIKIDNYKIDLKGTWKYKCGYVMKELEEQTFFQYKPTGLFNGLIYPIKDYKIKGVLWYQGESNIENYEDYSDLFSDMVSDWRMTLNNNELPIICTQLAGYGNYSDFEQDSNLVKLRNEQTKCLKIHNTRMVVAYDLGEWNDIHPQNKKDVGKRLAFAAKNMVYFEKETFLSPVLENIKIKENTLTLKFRNCKSGLFEKDKESKSCFIAEYDDGTIEKIYGEIDNNKIIINSNLKKIVVIYYGWSNFPLNAKIYNEKGLPITPFKIGL